MGNLTVPHPQKRYRLIGYRVWAFMVGGVASRFGETRLGGMRGCWACDLWLAFEVEELQTHPRNYSIHSPFLLGFRFRFPGIAFQHVQIRNLREKGRSCRGSGPRAPGTQPKADILSDVPYAVQLVGYNHV